MSAPSERIRVRWAGLVVDVDVVRRFKNGRVAVAYFGPTARGWTPGHRFGHADPPERFTVEPWQIVGGV